MVQATDRARRRELAHVLWLGGPPDCGKTSIAQIIAQLMLLCQDPRAQHQSGRVPGAACGTAV
ncbi:MAG TPA: hypothetical protein VIL85_08885, partial [Thermomicrobiales bacterium]